ncbi:MAG: PorT family protein [Prevotella sp.]|nr:PorT family protein [Prevotella sp.]
MKCRIVIAFFSLLLSASVYAQSLWDISKPDHNFTYGFRVGINFSSTDMDYATSTRNGFHLEATIDWNIVKSFSMSSGLEFVSKGFKSNFGKGETDYLQMPLHASYRIETVTGVQFHFNVGPYFAWGISGSVDYKPYDATFSYYYQQDSFGANGFFKHFDAGLSAGAYIKLNHILFGVSYEYGLVDIAKVYGKFHNRNVSVNLGYNL